VTLKLVISHSITERNLPTKYERCQSIKEAALETRYILFETHSKHINLCVLSVVYKITFWILEKNINTFMKRFIYFLNDDFTCVCIFSVEIALCIFRVSYLNLKACRTYEKVLLKGIEIFKEWQNVCTFTVYSNRILTFLFDHADPRQYCYSQICYRTWLSNLKGHTVTSNQRHLLYWFTCKHWPKNWKKLIT
jgi:hypothetical protein